MNFSFQAITLIQANLGALSLSVFLNLLIL